LYKGIFHDSLKITVIKPLYTRKTKSWYDKIQAYFVTNDFYCDMAQISDCVNHVILFSKLQFYGIQ